MPKDRSMIPVCLTPDEYDASPVVFAPGRYQKEKERLAKGFVTLLGISPKAAKLIADKAAEDAYAALKAVQSSLKYGTAKGADKSMTISETAKVKGVRATNPLTLCAVLEFIDKAGKSELSYGFTGWVLSQNMREYVEEVEANVVIDDTLSPEQQEQVKHSLQPSN